MLKRLILLVSIVVLLAGMLPVTQAEPAEQSVPAAQLDPHYATEWMQVIYDRIYAEGHNPPLAARAYAYAGITLYESLLYGIPVNLSLAGQIRHMPDMPIRPEGTYDWIALSNRSMYRVMSELLPINPETSEETLDALTDHYEAVKAAREEESGADVVAASDEFGDEVADTLLAWIAADGVAGIRELDEYVLPDENETDWEITTEGALPMEPYWAQIRPLILDYASECAVPLNVAFDTEPDSTFYLQAEEVLIAGQELTPEQIEIAFFWVDAPSLSGTPAGHWMLIAGLMVDRLDLTLSEAASMYAMVGIAVGEAFTSAWEAKYRYNLLRPVTYINRYIRRSWGPLIETPPFPEYPSGHSVVSGSAATVLTALFGQVAYTDDSGLSRDLQPRSFTSFEAAASEAAISRLYGGIHYRFGIENGVAQGRCVGETINSRIRLIPFRQE